MGDIKVNTVKTDAITDKTGTSALTIDSTGRVTTPARPVFIATMHGADQTGITGSASSPTTMILQIQVLRTVLILVIITTQVLEYSRRQ